MPNTDNHLYEFGPYCIDIEKGRLWRSKKELHIRPASKRLLLVLVNESLNKKGGRIIEPIEPSILKRKVGLWDNRDGLESLYQAVKRLREDMDDVNGKYLETVGSEGYRLSVPISPKVDEAIGYPPDTTQKPTKATRNAMQLLQIVRRKDIVIDLLLLVSIVAVLFLLPSEPNCFPEPIPAIELVKESPPTQPLEVTVVTVNELGSETDRSQQVQHYTEDLCKGIKLDMVMIPGGKFQMGSRETESERDSEGDEVLHEVNIGYWFFLGQYEVTHEQWRAVASRNDLKEKLDLPRIDPSYFEGDDKLPVENISWYEAVEFCARLTKMTGRHYRLPSEAEWEYACRAGTKTPFGFGQTVTRRLANYDWTESYNRGQKWEKSSLGTKKVGSFKANDFGLYDMHGNVWEYCQDWTDGVRTNDYKSDPADGRPRAKCAQDFMVIVRGGGWRDPPTKLRSADRGYGKPEVKSFDTGLRVVMDGTLPKIQPVRCP